MRACVGGWGENMQRLFVPAGPCRALIPGKMIRSLFFTIGSIVLYSVGNSQLQNKCVVLFGRRCVHHEGSSKQLQKILGHEHESII